MYLDVCPRQGSKIEGVVLHRVGILEVFGPSQSQGPSRGPSHGQGQTLRGTRKHGSSAPPSPGTTPSGMGS